MISKDIDAKKACTTMGICSANSAFENVSLYRRKSMIYFYL
jgi:hypothetical protein